MAAAEVYSKTYSAGQTIFTEGEPGFVLYVVRTGKVMITKRKGSASTLVATLGPGEFVGEMAVASGARRWGTATAAVDCVLTALPKELIERRMDEADPVLKMLLLTAFERLRVLSAQSNDYTLNS